MVLAFSHVFQHFVGILRGSSSAGTGFFVVVPLEPFENVHPASFAFIGYRPAVTSNLSAIDERANDSRLTVV